MKNSLFHMGCEKNEGPFDAFKNGGLEVRISVDQGEDKNSIDSGGAGGEQAESKKIY